MDKNLEALLAKVSADRRRFVQTLLGLAGYGVPTVRTFMMATATVGPALSLGLTTTAAPTTTRNPWRPRVSTGSEGRHQPLQPESGSLINSPRSGSAPLINPEPSGSGSVTRRQPSGGSDSLIQNPSEHSDSLLNKPHPGKIDPRKH